MISEMSSSCFSRRDARGAASGVLSKDIIDGRGDDVPPSRGQVGARSSVR